jgi:hypothetical protein
MSDKFFAGFDSETGGFNPETADLLTYYMCIVDEDFKLLDEVDLRLKPDGGRLPVAEAQALAVNKIDIRAHLEDPRTVTYSEGKAQLEAMLKKYSKKTGRSLNIRPLGYNVPFDLRWTFKHLLNADEWESYMHYQFVDVMQNVNFLKDSGWFPKDLGRLESVVEFLQLPKRLAHTAKDDTLMTIDVHRKIVELMKSKKDGGSTQDLISLLEAE